MRQALRHIFKEIDHDKSMHVTLAELKEALSAKKLSSFMESMGRSALQSQSDGADGLRLRDWGVSGVAAVGKSPMARSSREKMFTIF